MTAISFGPEFLNALLSGSKQQTTRPVPSVPPKRPRFKVGDVAQIYNQQRRRIADKPLLICTKDGKWNVRELMNKRSHYPQLFYDGEGNKIWPHLLDWGAKCVRYPAHFLGTVEIAEVYDIHPSEMSMEEQEVWALADGFHEFAGLRYTALGNADDWFLERYGGNWMEDMFTVCRWNGWLERYFEPEDL